MVVLKVVVPKKDYDKFKPDEYESDAYRTLKKIPPSWIAGVVHKSDGGKALFMCVLIPSDPATLEPGTHTASENLRKSLGL